MTKKKTLKGIWFVLKDAFKGFSANKVPKLSASLAYCTVFSFGPLLIVLIYACSFFYGREAIEGNIYYQIKNFVGADTAAQLQQIIKNAAISGSGTLAIITGIVTLLIGATSIFGEIQDSIIKNRLLSFGMLGSLGFLLLVSLAMTTIIEGVGHRLQHYLPHITVVVLYLINLFMTAGLTVLLFAIIFKVLPDAEVKWKDVWAGALAAGLLFLGGKFLISFYISKSHVGTTYGTAGSLVVLLLWIYYSSLILYFGAEFTKAWAVKYRQGIKASPYAVVIEKTEKEQKTDKIK